MNGRQASDRHSAFSDSRDVKQSPHWVISVGRSQLDDRLIVRCATTARRVIERKRRLARLLGKGKRTAIAYNDHLAEDGITVFAHALPDGPRRHRVEADRQPLHQRTLKGVAQVEEPGERAVRREREEEAVTRLAVALLSGQSRRWPGNGRSSHGHGR